MAATTLTDRALVRLSGEDVHGFANGLVTNDVTGKLPVSAGLLTPQGKCPIPACKRSAGDGSRPLANPRPAGSSIASASASARVAQSSATPFGSSAMRLS